jgi:hypothetical protein
MRSLLLLVAGCLIIGNSLPAASAAEESTVPPVCVAPDGNDAHPGTIDQPVQSLHKALELSRRWRAEHAGQVPSIVLASGRYELAEPIVLTRADSDLSIVCLDEDEPAVLSGGRKITGWKRNGKLWQTTIEDVKSGQLRFRELFIDDERKPRARHPNNDYLRIERAGPDNRTSLFFKPGEVEPIANYGAAEIVFLHDWSISRIPIAGIDPDANRMWFDHPIGCSAPHYAITHFEKNPRFYLENAPEWLDAEGEWYLDESTGVLSYFTESESPPVAVAPKLERLLTIEGDANSESEPSKFTFERIAFSHCAWQLPAAGYAEGQATFYEPRDSNNRSARLMVPPAVKIDQAKVHMQACEWSQLGGSGLWLERLCTGSTIENCKFDDISGNGLMIGEMGARVPPGAAPDDTSLVTRNVRVSDCQVSRTGQQFFGAVGIWIAMAADCVVENCEITELPYTGISVGWRWNDSPSPCRGHRIESNHIHHVLQKLSDGGGVYTLGRQPGTVLKNNRIHDIPLNAGRAESNGFFHDEGSSEILDTGNIIYNLDRSPIRFHRAHAITVEHNTLVSRPGVPTFRYNNSKAETMTIRENRVIEATEWSPEAATESN